MQTLNEILNNNNWSGDVTEKTDKNTTHNYVDGFYENEFGKYKDKPVKILEIGISSGYSLLLWDKYFTNHTGVYGVDIFGGRIINEVRTNDKIKVLISDAYSEHVTNILPNFDIIVDDGPHTLNTMISCINLYVPKLNTGGILVIEDVQSMDWMTTLKDTFLKVKQKNDDFEIIDLRSTKGRYDDLMFVIRRK